MSFSATDRDVRLRDGGKPLWEKTNVREKTRRTPSASASTVRGLGVGRLGYGITISYPG